ncbi:MAG: hypothetical protein LUD81_07835 [Clostridiales bacterium]|nr:hypothetical protein [Clostridiales bacterium]
MVYVLQQRKNELAKLKNERPPAVRYEEVEKSFLIIFKRWETVEVDNSEEVNEWQVRVYALEEEIRDREADVEAKKREIRDIKDELSDNESFAEGMIKKIKNEISRNREEIKDIENKIALEKENAKRDYYNRQKSKLISDVRNYFENLRFSIRDNITSDMDSFCEDVKNRIDREFDARIESRCKLIDDYLKSLKTGSKQINEYDSMVRRFDNMLNELKSGRV